MPDQRISWGDITGIIAIVGVAMAGVAVFVNIERDLEEARRNMLPAGFVRGFVFMTENAACPAEQFTDITANFDKMTLFASKDVNGSVFLRQGDGAHEHAEDGAHSHQVTGITDRLGGGQPAGAGTEQAAHAENRVRVTGTALAEGSRHAHGGGQHEHAGVGFRLCRYDGAM